MYVKSIAQRLAGFQREGDALLGLRLAAEGEESLALQVEDVLLADQGSRRNAAAHDYRYFPEPDLLPLVLDAAWVEALRAELPELPDDKRARFHARYARAFPYDAGVLVAEQATALYFEAVARGRDAKQAANWVTGDLFAVLNRTGRGIEESPVSAEALGRILDLMADGTINGRIAKELFEAVAESGEAPDAIVEKRGLRQVTDSGAIEAAVKKVLAANPDKVAEYRGGKEKIYGFLVGQVMREMRGKGNPGLVNEALKRAL